MNGMILQTEPNSKDIKYSSKKSSDIVSEESGALFEKIVVSLIKEDKDSKNSNFLLSKLLNIPSNIDKKGKKISQFSKGELIEQLKPKSDTKSNKSEDLNMDDELVILEDLFKIALTLKSGESPNMDKIKSHSLKVALNNKVVINELKSAKNIKELLKIADKHGIRVKNFQFFQEEAALDEGDKKLVHKITSQEIFKMIEPKVKSTKVYKASKQSILTKLINKDKLIKQKKQKVQDANTSNIQKTKIKTDTKEVVIQENTIKKEDIKVKVTKTSKQHKTKQSQNKSPILDSVDMVVKEDNKEVNKVENNNEKIKIDNKSAINKQIDKFEVKQDTKQSDKLFVDQENDNQPTQKEINKEERVDINVQKKVYKKSFSDLSDLAEQKNNFKNIKKHEKIDIVEKDIIENTQDVTVEKHSSNHEVKIESTTKIKESQDVKKSLNTFAMEFKEKVESYKAPLMKVKMQLSPQNLGDVDVTLINRGSTLHVNITSNTNSMALFMQNQVEFKNSLVNMGFTDLQMNFSQSGNSQKEQQKQEGKSNTNYKNITNEEERDNIDIVIPNYV